MSRPDIRLVAVNHTALSLDHLFNAILHDSTHGACLAARDLKVLPDDHPAQLEPSEHNPHPQALEYHGRVIHLFSQRDPAKIEWNKAGADYIMESTGKMTTRDKARAHILSGAKRVLISAPSKDSPNIVYGVNHQQYDGQEVLSNASCTVSLSLGVYCTSS